MVAILFVVQFFIGMHMTGRIGTRREPPGWLPDVHRIIGTVAFGLSLPVAFHCLWALGYQSTDGRVLAHSLLGCVAYGTYAAKVVAVRSPAPPTWAAPGLGTLLGLTMLAVWWGSALHHYTT